MAKYDESFKRNIAEMIHSRIKTKAEIKREYGISPSTVAGWEKNIVADLRRKKT